MVSTTQTIVTGLFDSKTKCHHFAAGGNNISVTVICLPLRCRELEWRAGRAWPLCLTRMMNISCWPQRATPLLLISEWPQHTDSQIEIKNALGLPCKFSKGLVAYCKLCLKYWLDTFSTAEGCLNTEFRGALNIEDCFFYYCHFLVFTEKAIKRDNSLTTYHSVFIVLDELWRVGQTLFQPAGS